MTGLYKPGDSLVEVFTTSDSTGAAVNADSAPTGTVYRNGAADGAVTVTITNLATGVYKLAAIIPIGYSAGDKVDVLVSTFIGGIAVNRFIGTNRLVAFDSTDGADLGLSAVNINLSQALSAPASTDGTQANTVGEALVAARAQGFSKWTLVGATLTIYGPDGTTPWRVFTLNSGTAPTSRT